MNKNWINFKELRAQLSFSQILEFYGIRGLTLKGGQYVGFCPFPAHNGNKRSPSFSAHPEKGIFQCFGCGSKGNLLDFAVLMDNGNPKRGLDVRKTALKLHKQFNLISTAQETGGQYRLPTVCPPPTRAQPAIVNQVLNFRLKDLDPEHPYLANRGFSRETMEHFGVGFCSRGVFAGRITIPLHNNEGDLIGYAGRVVDDSTVSSQNPKYLFPSKREREGEVLEFKKSLLLYNGSRFKEPLIDLIVVEGFPSVWWLTQNGFPEAVALMGSSFSKEQLGLIQELTAPQGHVWVMADGDPAGVRLGKELCSALHLTRMCRLILEDKRQPTDFSKEELQALLGR